MALKLSAAHSSRINRPRHPNPRRSSSSPFSQNARRKPVQRASSKAEDDLLHSEISPLVTPTLLYTLAPQNDYKDAVAIFQHVQSHMFDPIPDGGGFNSIRIAEILNFRSCLPPATLMTHALASAKSATRLEREIDSLVKAGRLRKISVSQRGPGGSHNYDSLIIMEDLFNVIRSSTVLSEEIKERFVAFLSLHTSNGGLDMSSFTFEEILMLKAAGFLTSNSMSDDGKEAFTGADKGAMGTATSIASISRAASGSYAAVGGSTAIDLAGGRAGLRRDDIDSKRAFSSQDATHAKYQLNVPGMGPYLRLLISARAHLLALMSKSRVSEVPLYLLREQWDGAICGSDAASQAKKYRGEFAGVLPARTRKWKLYNGLSLDIALADCLGAGLVELSDTRSVGLAVRKI